MLTIKKGIRRPELNQKISLTRIKEKMNGWLWNTVMPLSKVRNKVNCVI